MESDSEMFVKKVDSNAVESNLSGQKIFLVDPLNDHDYTHKNDSLLPVYKIEPKKKTGVSKKQKITCIKAVHNCKICGYNTMDKEIMSKHMKLHEGIKPGTKYVPCGSCTAKKIPEGYEQCPDCSFFSKSKLSLKIHMRIHTNGTPYKCTDCTFSGKDLKELIKHYNEVKNFTCLDCSYVTHVSEKMLRHVQIHDKFLICEVCGMSYVNSHNLLRHHMKCHSIKLD